MRLAHLISHPGGYRCNILESYKCRRCRFCILVWHAERLPVIPLSWRCWWHTRVWLSSIQTIQYFYNRNPDRSFLSITTVMNASRSDVVSPKDKLPITIFDSPALQGYKSDTTRKRQDSLRLAIQYLAVVILLNILLYKAVRFSSPKIQRVHYCSHENGTLAPSRSEVGSNKFPTALGSGSNNVEDRHLSAWLLAVVLKAKRHQYHSNPIMWPKFTPISFPKISPSNCAANIIAPLINLVDSLFPLQSQIINFAAAHIPHEPSLSQASDPLALLNLRFPNPLKLFERYARPY